MKWIEILVKTTSEFEEQVTNIFYEADIQGIIIEDYQDILNLEKNKDNWDIIDQGLLDNYYEGITIKGYLEEEKDAEAKINFIKEKIHGLPRYDLDIKSEKIKISTIENRDWNLEFKKHFKSFNVGKNIIIKPSWEEIKDNQGKIVIEIDPGMAFGTGTHPTTRLCLEALEKYIKKQDMIYDIGTGSGILAIAADKLGGSAIGIDIDEDSIKTAKNNVKTNKSDKNVKILKGNLLNKLTGKANIIVSNIIADAIINMSSVLRAYIKKDGYFIASGILENKEMEAIEVLKANNFNIIEVNKLEEWVCIIAKKENNE